MTTPQSCEVEDWLYDYIVEFLRSPTFKNPIKEFIDNNCSTFENKEENKLEHTLLHNKFKELIENSLEFMLIELNVNHEQFLKCAKVGLEDEKDKKHFENIIACDNFLYFKSMMVQRNAQLQEQAYKLMIASENKNSINTLTNDEAYNTLLKIKENTELECAIAMSLALAEEKTKIIGSNYDEELLKALEASKNYTHKGYKEKSDLDNDAPISLFDRNTLKLRESNNKKDNSISITSSNYENISKPSEQNKTNNLTLSTETNNSINIKGKEKPDSSYKELAVSGKEVNFNHLSTNDKTKVKQDNKIEGNINSINIEGKREEFNNVWKQGLNKQGNIDLAYIASSNKDNNNNNNNKSSKKNIFEMVGNVGTVEINEKNDNKVKDVPKDLFDNNNNTNNINNIDTKENNSNSKLYTNDKPSKKVLNKVEQEEIDKHKVDNINVENKNNDKNALEYTSIKEGNILDNKYSKNLGKYEGNDIENIEFSNKLNLDGINSKLDNNADTSEMQKWKNFTKTSIDHGNIDVSTIKSKINTGINSIKSMDSQFQKENDDLKKKFAQLQKEKEDKIKDYRDMLLKMKMDKNKEETKNTSNIDKIKLEMRKNLANKLKN